MAGAYAAIGGQQIPDREPMKAAVRDIDTAMSGIAGSCQTLANELEQFGGDVESAQNAIRDLLEKLKSLVKSVPVRGFWGNPICDLVRQVAEGSTHRVGDADRVVLGKWDGPHGGYIGEAEINGGIHFNTADDVWAAVEHGLGAPDAKTLGWQVNEQFLRSQLESGVGRIDYILDRTEFSSLEDVVFFRAGSFSAMEIDFLFENAAKYGYNRIGDSFVRLAGR